MGNKIFKATIATALMTGAVVATGPIQTQADTQKFTDVRDIPSHHFYEAVMKYSAAGMIDGYKDGTFKPGQNITRQDAAKLLALVLDLDLDKMDNPGFKDVSKTHASYKYIAALVEAGIISGYEDNTFRPNDSLTRAQMAKILVLGFELDGKENVELPFKDINAKQWHMEFVRSLYGHEITTGTTPTTFSPNAHVTRGQMASFVFRGEAFITPKVDENQVAVDAAANLLKAGTVNVSRGPLATEETKLAAVTKYAASLMTDKGITVKASEGKTAGSYIISLTKGEAKVDKTIEVKFDYAADDLFISSVKAVNAKQVQIHFTTPVAKSSVLDASGNVKNITFTMVSGATVNPGTLTGSLSEDGKVLTINANWIFDGEYAFKATSAITSAKGEKFEEHTSILKAEDKVGPKYVSGSAAAKTATNLFNVNFDEPVNAAGVIAYVNDIPATVANSPTNPNQLIITANKAIAAGTTAKVRLLNVKDYKNNFADPNPVHAEITISADTVAPTVTGVKVLGENRIEVTYDKDMNLSSFANHARLVHSNGQILPLTASVGKDAKTVILTGSGIFYTDKYDAVLFIDSDVEDTVGNNAKTYSTTVTMVKDTTAPALTTVEYVNGKIVATFTKDIVLGGNRSILAINKKTGVSTPINLINGNNAVVAGNTLTITQSLPNANYQLRLPENTVTDKASRPNANKLEIMLFAVTNEVVYDTVRPVVENIKNETTQPGSSIGTEQRVTYTAIDNESGIDLSTIQEINNYTWDGKALPYGSYVTTTFVGTADRATNVTVTVHIPSSLITETKRSSFTVNNIRDNARNIVEVRGVGDVTLINSAKPKLIDAKVVSGNSLVFTFSEAVSGVDNSDFQVFINERPIPATALRTVERSNTEPNAFWSAVIGTVAKNVAYNGIANRDVVYFDTDGISGYSYGDLVVEVLPQNNNYANGSSWTVNLLSNEIGGMRVKLVENWNSPVQNAQGIHAEFDVDVLVRKY
ncbi:S-layer homology domain-containing protein [Sporosarcina sp. Sa2YVA2]|uniref:S-layer homology domain-containing protein n=1 Tax=Sporosarcina quadrami TaxID=2762234 RepID=A0ABR8U937_9BACL|nr:S-layer homology domain-containing protein [Sporosarcina quadrami]MBD7984541.1 S-layer homology domain-containing protein [Sporosarcina quadrami]